MVELFYGYRCPECTSDELIDNCDMSSAATKAICKRCGYNGVVEREDRLHRR
jgi:predicted RNA-binding Zn-ribbon protein involved in translation (DUF1610 family)